MKVKNAAGRLIEISIGGKVQKLITGARKYKWHSKLTSLTDALKKCGLKEGIIP